MKKQVITNSTNNLSVETLISFALPKVGFKTENKLTRRSIPTRAISPTLTTPYKNKQVSVAIHSKSKNQNIRTSSPKRIPYQNTNENWFRITWNYLNTCNINPSSKRAVLLQAATNFHADFTVSQLAKLASCDPSVIYKDIKTFITIKIIKEKVKGSYADHMASIYELVEQPRVFTKTSLECRNRAFFKELTKVFSNTESKTAKWALFRWSLDYNDKPWTIKELVDYAGCSIRTIQRSLAALQAAKLITTRSKNKKNARYRFTKLVPVFSTVKINRTVRQQLLSTSTSTYTSTRLTSTTISIAIKDWSFFNSQANARAALKYEDNYNSKRKLFTGLPVKAAIKNLELLGINRAGAVNILANYHDVYSCEKFHKIYQALVSKLVVDGDRIVNHGAFSYKALMDCNGLGLDLVTEVEYYQNYKRINYQDGLKKLEQQRKNNPSNQIFTRLIAFGRRQIEKEDIGIKYWQNIEPLYKCSNLLSNQLISAMHCQITSRSSELVSTSYKTLQSNTSIQQLWDKYFLAIGITQFLNGLDSDLIKWNTYEDKHSYSDLWTRVQQYPCLNRLITSTADANECWRYTYFYNVLQYGRQIIAANAMCISGHLESAEIALRDHLKQREATSTKSLQTPYATSSFAVFFKNEIGQKTTPLITYGYLKKKRFKSITNQEKPITKNHHALMKNQLNKNNSLCRECAKKTFRDLKNKKNNVKLLQQNHYKRLMLQALLLCFLRMKLDKKPLGRSLLKRSLGSKKLEKAVDNQK